MTYAVAGHTGRRAVAATANQPDQGNYMNKRYFIASMVFIASGCSAASDGGEVVGESAQALTSGHTYNLGALVRPGACMDVASGGTADGTNVQEWTCNGTGAQAFQLQAIDSTWYKIVNTNSGKCVDVVANGTADGTNIQLWTCNGTTAQAWQLVPSGSSYKIVGQTSNKCIDVAGSGTADGTNIQLWTCNGTNAQSWSPADVTTGGGGCNATVWACGPDAGCPNGPSYVTWDIVLYQPDGQYYQATHDNGGLDPTVSTFFWSPTTCGGGGGGGGGGYSGYASYNIYDGVPASSVYCDLDPAQFGMMVTALRTDLADAYAAAHGQSACGLCARVTSNGKTVIAHIIDHSNDFTDNGGQRYLDLSAQAFQSIGSLDSGVIPVEFSIGACP